MIIIRYSLLGPRGYFCAYQTYQNVYRGIHGVRRQLVTGTTIMFHVDRFFASIFLIKSPEPFVCGCHLRKRVFVLEGLRGRPRARVWCVQSWSSAKCKHDLFILYVDCTHVANRFPWERGPFVRGFSKKRKIRKDCGRRVHNRIGNSSRPEHPPRLSRFSVSR